MGSIAARAPVAERTRRACEHIERSADVGPRWQEQELVRLQIIEELAENQQIKATGPRLTSGRGRIAGVSSAG